MELSAAALAVAGRCEGRVNELARRMTREAFERLPAYQELPGEVKDVEMAATARHAVRLFLRRVGGRAEEGDLEFRYFRERAAQRAEEGVPLHLLLGTHLLGQHVLWQALRDSAEPGEEAALNELAGWLLEAQARMVPALAESYLDERAALEAEAREERRTLVRALVEGSPLTPERYGRLGVADGGLVLRIGVETPGGGPPEQVAARRLARRLGTAVNRLFGPEPLAWLEADGGVLVLPRDGAGGLPALPGGLTGQLERAAGAPVRVAALPADSGPGVAAAARTAAEVLRLVRALGRPPGLHRLEDVLLEYHLSRPDESSAGLVALLDPVYERPELLATLRAHLAERQDRRRTARALGLHPNTVDNRLARIGELTGAEVGTAHGFALLLTAYTQRELRP
ncbi:helix-turn-helix domain-containing protein [Kitasatospora sp. NPDC002040]|uniref:PucR family transcriptional regulator n=1 Tax=Kitasatospora sp. NPDC002040 TaxID=3154661 RepID=UPI00332A18B9